MVGIETLAMEVSSTCMNVPSASATAVSALRLPASAALGPRWRNRRSRSALMAARGLDLHRRPRAAARSARALRLSRAGSCAFGPALSAMMDAMRASTAGSSPALACFGSGTLRTAAS